MLITETTQCLLGKQTEMKEDGWGTGLLFFFIIVVMQNHSKNVSYDFKCCSTMGINVISFCH